MLVNIGNAQHIGAERTQNLHKLVQIAELVRQEGERDVLPVELHLRGQQLLKLGHRLADDVLANVAFQHIVHIVDHLGNFLQGGLVIKAADGVVRQLLCGHLRAPQAGGVQNDKKLRQHTAVLCRTDAVVAGDNLDFAVDERAEREAFKLAPLFDVVGKLLLHLGLHNASVDVLLAEVGQLYFGNDQTGTHIGDRFILYGCAADLVFSRCFCHRSSLPNHSFNACLAFLSYKGDSYVSR